MKILSGYRVLLIYSKALPFVQEDRRVREAWLALSFHKKCMTLLTQPFFLFILALPIACISWTVTHEEIFREPREYCQQCSKEKRTILARKFFYVFTCEYCFSFYVTALVLIITHYR